MRFWTPAIRYQSGIAEQYLMLREIERAQAHVESENIAKGIADGTLIYTR